MRLLKILIKSFIGFVLFFIWIGFGAWLEGQFPEVDVTMYFGLATLVLLAILIYKVIYGGFSALQKRSLLSSGFYNKDILNKMSYKELNARYSRQKLDPQTDYSTYSFEQIIKMQQEDEANARAAEAAKAAKAAAEDPYYGRNFVCNNCGAKMTHTTFGWVSGFGLYPSECAKSNRKCVPYEI